MTKTTISITLDIDVLAVSKIKTDNLSNTINQLLKAYNNTTEDTKDLSEIKQKESEILRLQAEMALLTEAAEKKQKEIEKKAKEPEYIQRPEAKSKMVGLLEAHEKLKKNNWDYDKVKGG